MSRTADFYKKIIEWGELELASQDNIHWLRTLVTDKASLQDLTSIDYKNSLLSGIRLDPVVTFTEDGLIDNVIYNYEGAPVLCVTEKYTYNEQDEADASIPKSKRGISGRLKIWEYHYENGTLDKDDTEENRSGKDRITSKDKYKTYNNITGLEVGVKRRKNIQVIAAENMSAALLIMGQLGIPNSFTSKKQAFNQMRKISNRYAGAFNQYEKYGTEAVFKKIQDDTEFNWLDIRILTDVEIDASVPSPASDSIKGAFSAFKITQMQGMTIRDYFISKLKGDIL